MSTQKGGQVHRSKSGRRILNVLTTIMGAAGIEFSSRYNALYGMQEWLAIMIEMCSQRLTAASAVRNLKNTRAVPSEKWFRDRMHTICPDNAEAACNMMIRRTVQMARRFRMFSNGSILVAIDKHLICRYDVNNMKHLIYSAWKNGTKQFEAYATMQIVDAPMNVKLGCVRVTRDLSNVDFVRKFVQILRDNKITARLILVDREFFSVDIMNAISESGNKYLMPAVKNKGIKDAIEAYHHGLGDAVSWHTMKNEAGRHVTFVLIIRRKADVDDDEKEKLDRDVTSGYVVFATNLPIERAHTGILMLPKTYRMRWGIETAYRQIEEVRPWTTSRDATFRMILFFASLFMYNMWAIEHARRGVNPKESTLRSLVYAAALIAVSNIATRTFDPGGPG